VNTPRTRIEVSDQGSGQFQVWGRSISDGPEQKAKML
jgi:hypothetical protein